MEVKIMTIVFDSPIPSPIIHADNRTQSVPAQRMIILGGWQQYELLRQGCEKSKRIKLAYYDGEIEIIMPGQFHELFKTIIGMLIEAYLIDRRIEFLPTGSMTQKVEQVAAVEADESYVIGQFKLSIEVTVTSGDISKLRIYKELDIHEVWFWDDGVLVIYHLNDDGYERVIQSQIPELQSIDWTVLSNCILMGETSRIQAIETFRAAHPIK
jgi:Uma2 family endonuclease